ncbi:MAG: glycosyltransferase family 4 protein [Collinsella sp.]|nr:glycosyltransferase family 4 protein [Collinsella sp.]
MRRRFGIGEGATFITVYAWSPEVKGLDIACEAVKELREQGLAFELGIVGAENLDQTRQWVDDRTSTSASAPWIHFLPPTEDVFEYHAIADIVLSASRSEGFSYVLCEAILAGKPCVASDISGTKWSRAFDTVEFFKSEDIVACATALAAIDKRRCTKGFKDALLLSSKECAIRYNTRRWAEEVYSFYDVMQEE